MTEIRFYHLLATSLEKALPRLLEKLLARDLRAVVLASSRERVEALDSALWTYRPDSFLPHGCARDGLAQEQPVWLTDRDENPNHASVLILTDGATSLHIDDYDLCLEFFDGTDTEALAAARRRWRAYKERKYTVLYYQQNERGGWETRE
jgi:DNA polymerase-3 subunit chi